MIRNAIRVDGNAERVHERAFASSRTVTIVSRTEQCHPCISGSGSLLAPSPCLRKKRQEINSFGKWTIGHGRDSWAGVVCRRVEPFFVGFQRTYLFPGPSTKIDRDEPADGEHRQRHRLSIKTPRPCAVLAIDGWICRVLDSLPFQTTVY